METEHQYNLALYSLPVISIEIIAYSIHGIVFYNNVPKNIYYYVMLGLLVVSILSFILSLLAIYYEYMINYNLIIVLFISMLVFSYISLNICDIIYNNNSNTIYGYILSGFIVVLELGMIFLLLLD
jgi:hypothetical protein